MTAHKPSNTAYKPFNPRDLSAWRALCEWIEEWLAKSGPPSRRRSSVGTEEVDEAHRWLLAVPMRISSTTLEQLPDGSLIPARVGNLCGLQQWQAREVTRVRREYRLVLWGRTPGEGWSLCVDRRGRPAWRERLAELREAEGV